MQSLGLKSERDLIKPWAAIENWMINHVIQKEIYRKIKFGFPLPLVKAFGTTNKARSEDVKQRPGSYEVNIS